MKARKERGLEVGAPRRIDVEKAEHRLREGRSITEAAKEQGFSRAALGRYFTVTEAFALRTEGPIKPAPKRRK